MNVQAMSTFKNGTTVRDVLVAKAIQNGYNPYCRSTDANARKITEEMRVKAQNIRVPSSNTPCNKVNKPPVREVKAMPRERNVRAHREVISIENFELVRRKSPALSLGMLVSVMVSAIVLAMVVYSGSLINEKSREFSDISYSISVLEEENKALTLELAKKNDLVVIEDIAKNDLGMIKVAEAEQRYANLGAENSVNTYETAEEDNTVTMYLLNTFGEKIGDFLEYLD
ncbi:MAG: cell division protein FtsL [Clostridia bacterium]|nr:cell division protein FtsL [Clostridia bacterium]